MTIATLSKRLFLAITTIAFCQSAMAYADIKPWYVSADLGIFQGNYDLIYNDMVDIIPVNVRQTLQQYGYTGGLAVGYSQTFRENYLLGAEFSGNIATNNAYLASGFPGMGISDKIKIQNYFDLVAVPGIFITDSVAAYVKAGVSCAYIKDSLNSPAGYAPTYITVNSNNYNWGVALGIGLKKYITHQFAVFSEYQYHDYGTINFPGFLNFEANYSHSSHVYSQAITLGASYIF